MKSNLICYLTGMYYTLKHQNESLIVTTGIKHLYKFKNFFTSYIYFARRAWKESYYFLLYTQESIGFTKIFHIRFSMDLHVLRCSEHDLTMFRKCLSVCLYACFQNILDTVYQELMCRNWWNFIFHCTLM